MSAVIERVAPGGADEDSSKRRQIVEGARQVFMAQGFDAASMGEIARVAGVSKGTLYVYFKNKEELFEAIVGQQCRVQAEQIFNLDHEDRNVEEVLTRLGVAFVQFLCRPGAAPPFRTVIAIAERMPELGRISREEAAALAGLAPFDHDSGKYKGQRHIAGGRGRLRAAGRRGSAAGRGPGPLGGLSPGAAAAGPGLSLAPSLGVNWAHST